MELEVAAYLIKFCVKVYSCSDTDIEANYFSCAKGQQETVRNKFDINNIADSISLKDSD